MSSLKDHFLIDPSVTFFNHGSYGATPKPVFDEYQRWQRVLEQQPVAYFRAAASNLLAARTRLAEYLGTTANNLGFIVNASFGINVIAHSLARSGFLSAGDEVLTSHHEYGAVDRAWRFHTAHHGVNLVVQPTPVPLNSPEEFAAAFWKGVTPRTKVIALSHITSPTAVVLPLAPIIRRAREAGIVTVIDGAHATSQIDLALDDFGADFYFGNCHKWLCAPKGSGFLYARTERLHLVQPLTINWGWIEGQKSEHPLSDYVETLGTRDLAAFLSVPAAIEFQQSHNWSEVRAGCHALASRARAEVIEMFDTMPLTPDSPDWFVQLCALPLPPGTDMTMLKNRLLDEFNIEIPCLVWNGIPIARLSVQAYNDEKDINKLIGALGHIILGKDAA